jgi:L-asparagine oxygenase
LLLCLRGDPEAKTMLCAIADVLPRLSNEMIAMLRQRRFRTRPDASFLDGDAEAPFGPAMPVLAGDAARPTFTYDEDLMIGVDEEAQAVLEHLGRLVHECATEVVLEAGDLLLVDNHQVVHARSPFRARFDGTDRWLQRAFVVSDLRASADERSGRIIMTRF